MISTTTTDSITDYITQDPEVFSLVTSFEFAHSPLGASEAPRLPSSPPPPRQGPPTLRLYYLKHIASLKLPRGSHLQCHFDFYPILEVVIYLQVPSSTVAGLLLFHWKLK